MIGVNQKRIASEKNFKIFHFFFGRNPGAALLSVIKYPLCSLAFFSAIL